MTPRPIEHRQIEFRAWDKTKKEMTRRAWPKMAINSDGTFGFPKDELYTLMQFTGLYDKNKKKIFEGDILSDGDLIGVVTYVTDMYVFPDDKWDEFEVGAYWARKPDGEWSPLFSFISEVIGNIYENPELLDDD